MVSIITFVRESRISNRCLAEMAAAASACCCSRLAGVGVLSDGDARESDAFFFAFANTLLAIHGKTTAAANAAGWLLLPPPLVVCNKIDSV